MNTLYFSDMAAAFLAATVLTAPALGCSFLLMLTRRDPAEDERPPQRGTLPQTPDNFTEQVRAQLLSLSVRAYERLIAEVLRAAGYEEVRVLRDHRVKRRSHKGRTAHGGVDITAVSRTELSAAPMVVQVKQYQRPVSRRFVDELRGALLRTQARHGLLITTSTFAPAARRAALEDHVGPVRLIDGLQLQKTADAASFGRSSDPSGRLDFEPSVLSSAGKGDGVMGHTHVLVGVASLWDLERRARLPIFRNHSAVSSIGGAWWIALTWTLRNRRLSDWILWG